MQVLIAINNDGNSNDSSDICLTESGQVMDLNPRMMYLHAVNNVTCVGDGLNDKPAIMMDIIENKDYGLLVGVASEDEGNELIRRLGKEDYLDLTEHYVCLDIHDKLGIL